MLRRDFISFLGGALVAGSRVAIAQTPSKVYRVGTLLPGAPVDEKSPLGALLRGRSRHQTSRADQASGAEGATGRDAVEQERSRHEHALRGLR